MSVGLLIFPFHLHIQIFEHIIVIENNLVDIEGLENLVVTLFPVW